MTEDRARPVGGGDWRPLGKDATEPWRGFYDLSPPVNNTIGNVLGSVKLTLWAWDEDEQSLDGVLEVVTFLNDETVASKDLGDWIDASLQEHLTPNIGNSDVELLALKKLRQRVDEMIAAREQARKQTT
jgi:hypothetical protein